MLKKWFLFIFVVFALMAFIIPKDFNYFYQKGFKSIEEGNYAAAIYYLDSAIALNPQADSAYSLIAYPYYYLGKTEKALEYCNKALAINSENPYAYFIKGATISLLNVSSDSLTKLLKKHKKDSVWVSEFLNRYFVANYVGYSGIYDYGKAIEEISKCIALDSTYSLAYSFRAYYSFVLGRSEQAGLDYNRCIDLDSDNAIFYLKRGIYREQYSSPGDARDDYSKGIELDSNIAELYEKRGMLYYHVFHDREYACKDLTKATLLGKYIDNLSTYCEVTEWDTLLRYYGGKSWRHDYIPYNCTCPNFKDMFNPETDTIKEFELLPGIKEKIIDIKDSEKTTWEFEDGRIIVISKKTKARWLKEAEETKRKELMKTP